MHSTKSFSQLIYAANLFLSCISFFLISCKEENGNQNCTQDSTLTCAGPSREWRLLGLENENITGVAIHPCNPQIMFAGTQFDFSAGVVGKLYKTEDCGQTWTKLLEGGLSYRNIVIDPNDPDVVYVLNGTILKSTNGGRTWKSINDGIRIDFEIIVQTLAIDPMNSNVLFAGTGGFGSGALYKSSNGGSSWRQLTYNDSNLFLNQIGSISIDPQNSQIVYVGVSGFPGSVVKSVDGGKSWAATGLSDTGQLINFIYINPANTETLFAGLSFLGIKMSQDGGDTWIDFNQGLSSPIHAIKVQTNPITDEFFLVTSWDDDGWIYTRAQSNSIWTRSGIDSVRRSYYYGEIAIDQSQNMLIFGTLGMYGFNLK